MVLLKQARTGHFLVGGRVWRGPSGSRKCCTAQFLSYILFLFHKSFQSLLILLSFFFLCRLIGPSEVCLFVYRKSNPARSANCDGAEWKYSGRLDNQETKGRQQKQPGRRQSMTANETLKSNFLLSFHLLNQ